MIFGGKYVSALITSKLTYLQCACKATSGRPKTSDTPPLTGYRQRGVHVLAEKLGCSHVSDERGQRAWRPCVSLHCPRLRAHQPKRLLDLVQAYFIVVPEGHCSSAKGY